MSAQDDLRNSEESHESFGMIGFARVAGGGGKRRLLFGSHLENHYETIQMTIKTAVRKHGLSRDWHHGIDTLIQVEMSPVQFSQLLTTMNFGDGVPCTIRYKAGQGYLEPVPDSYVPEPTKILNEAKSHFESLFQDIDTKSSEIDKILSKKTLSKQDKQRIKHLSNDIFAWAKANAPFIFRSFESSIEKVVTAAKAQVEEFALSTLIRAGMQKLIKNFELPEHFSSVTGELMPGKGIEKNGE